MPVEIDLNAARAARREAQKEAPTVSLGEQTFTLPVELPMAVLEFLGALQSGGPDMYPAAVSLVRGLLGDQADDFMAEQPSLGDLLALFEGIMPIYGTNMGEASGSES